MKLTLYLWSYTHICVCVALFLCSYVCICFKWLALRAEVEMQQYFRGQGPLKILCLIK